ncbi:MAG TPA: hypothetical protein VFQ23_11840, partial [Anaerolineales bacterium]|nr:hypothetical protein [Anaerolineales bacterium]
LKVMGYDLSDLHRELDSAKMSWQHVISDGVALLNMKNRTANFLRGIWRGSFSPAGSPRL